MWKREVVFGTLWTLVMASITYALTPEEVELFESQSTTAWRAEDGSLQRYFVNISTNDDDTFTFTSNGIPSVTGNYSENEQTLYTHNFKVTFPRFPQNLSQPECLPVSGMIGFASNGVALFSPFDMDGNDVYINGAFDTCDGRVTDTGIYYYTQLSDCFTEISEKPELFGIALDGFPIYTTGNSNITNVDLDVCHGRLENGSQYRYYVTKDFPYILGCFRGAPQEVFNGTSIVQSSSNCRYACNINGTTPESERTFCESTNQNLIFYIIIAAAGFVALVVLVLLLVCIVKCVGSKCSSCGEKEDDLQYHL